MGRVKEAANLLLVLAYENNIDVKVRSAAARDLGQLGWVQESILSSLLSLAHDEDEVKDIRRAAYGSLKALLGGEKDENEE